MFAIFFVLLQEITRVGMLTIQMLMTYYSCSERTAYKKLYELQGRLRKKDINEYEFFRGLNLTEDAVCYYFGRAKAAKYREALRFG